MVVPCLFKRKRILMHILYKVAIMFMLASLLAGFIPPPLVSSVVDATLPAVVQAATVVRSGQVLNRLAQI